MTGRAPLAGVLVLAAALTACTAAPAGAPTDPPSSDAAAPAPPPAACLLDLDRFAADTGLTWAAATGTASDTRCLYDPDGAAEFVTVEVSDGAAPGADLDTVAGLCESGTFTPLGTAGFVCRFTAAGPSVFGAADTTDRLVTISASGVPTGSSIEQLVTAFTAQLTELG